MHHSEITQSRRRADSNHRKLARGALPRAVFGHVARQASEVEVSAKLLFADEDNLPGVKGEVFHHMEDSVQAGDLQSLDCVNSGQFYGRKAAQHPACVPNAYPEHLHQFRVRQRPAFGKFLVALARVRRSTDGGNDPLTDISGKVEGQVAGAVGGGVWPPPDLFRRKQIKASLDAGQMMPPQGVLRKFQERLPGIR